MENKIFRVMKLALTTLFIFTTGLLASVRSQNMRIDFILNNAKTYNILEEIEKQTDYLFIYLRGCCCKNKYKSRSFSHISQTFKVRLIISFFLPENLFPQFLTYFQRYNSDLAPELQKRPHPPHRDLSAADYKHLPPLKVHKQWKICHFFRSFPSFWYIFDSPPCLRQIFPINSIKIQFRLLKFYLFRRLFFPYPSGRIQIVKRKTK